MHPGFWFAFGLCALAGLSTGVGSLLGIFAKRTNTRFLSVALGFSAGVMIYISMVELLVDAQHRLVQAWGARGGGWIAAGAFFGGMLVIAVIDRLVPHVVNPHEVHTTSEMAADPARHKLLKTGVMTGLAVGIHNFPEGMATFFSALHDPAMGLFIAVAVAVHNIPEGIAVSVPIYFATGNRRKAFAYSFLSGVAEPVGALVGYLVLSPYLSETMFGIVFAAIAGIMVFISLDELLPTAREYGEHHFAISGVVAGMAVMAVSMLLAR